MNSFKKKITLIADVFPKLRTPKNVVRSMSKMSHCSGAFERKHRKHVQTLWKFQQQHNYHIYWSLWGQLSCKKPLLVIWKILRQFVNAVTADDKYSLLNIDNLTQPIQMLFSQKQKTFSWFFSAFLKFSLNFEHFQKKADPDSWCVSEITDSEKRG